MKYTEITKFHGRKAPEVVRDDRQAYADWILSADSASILTVTPVAPPELELARIRDSIDCSACGESVMATRIRTLNDAPVCIPCFEKTQTRE